MGARRAAAAAAAGLAAVIGLGLAGVGTAQQQRATPTRAQCWAGIKEAYPKTAFYHTCGPKELFCPNAGSPGRKTGHYLPNTPECVPRSPAELAEIAAEEARKARLEADIRAEVRRLGAHREAEIRRRLELRDRAAAARPAAPAPAPTPPRDCTRKLVPNFVHEYGVSQADAAAKARSDARLCASGIYRSMGEPSCSGGSGRPWSCSVTAQCEIELCSRGSSATRQ